MVSYVRCRLYSLTTSIPFTALVAAIASALHKNTVRVSANERMECRFQKCIPLAKEAGDLRRELAALKEKEQPRASPRALGNRSRRVELETQLKQDEANLEKLKQEGKYAECVEVKRRIEQARQMLVLMPEERTRDSVGRELQTAEATLAAKKNAEKWLECGKFALVIQMLKQELASMPEERTRTVVERELKAMAAQLNAAKKADLYGGRFQCAVCVR